jgi:adenylate kinase family enzyme
MFVVMSGLPGSGKSTLGRQLGAALGLDVLDKDDFLEAHFADYDEIDSTLRSTLSRLADAALQERALSVSSAVLVSFWRREQVSITAGTPTEWLAGLPNVVEVFCDCSPDVAEARFRSRIRHDVHRDADRTDLVAQFEALSRHGPLEIGRLVVANTEADIDIAELARHVRMRGL